MYAAISCDSLLVKNSACNMRVGIYLLGLIAITMSSPFTTVFLIVKPQDLCEGIITVTQVRSYSPGSV